MHYIIPMHKRQVIDGKQECIGCHQWLPLELFHKHKPSSTGRAWRCKECHKNTLLGGLTPSQRARKWALDNPERFAKLNLESRNRIIHDERRLEARRQNVRNHYRSHKDRVVASHRKWRENNPWAVVADRCRSLVRNTVNGAQSGGKRFSELVGTTGIQFRHYLQSKWLPGMSWINFGRGGWTIGHIKAVALFKDSLLTTEGLKACFHYSNLQPEWERSNLAKYTRESLTNAQIALENQLIHGTSSR